MPIGTTEETIVSPTFLRTAQVVCEALSIDWKIDPTLNVKPTLTEVFDAICLAICSSTIVTSDKRTSIVFAVEHGRLEILQLLGQAPDAVRLAIEFGEKTGRSNAGLVAKFVVFFGQESWRLDYFPQPPATGMEMPTIEALAEIHPGLATLVSYYRHST